MWSLAILKGSCINWVFYKTIAGHFHAKQDVDIVMRQP